MRRQSEAGPEVVLEKHELWNLSSTPASRVMGGREGGAGRVPGLTALPRRTMVPPNLSGSSVAGTAASTQPAEGSGAEGIERGSFFSSISGSQQTSGVWVFF